MSARERRQASMDLHAEKSKDGMREHLEYGDLMAWLRQWREDN